MQDSNFGGNQGNDGGGSFTKPPMFEGNWNCSDCKAEITKLPFEPKEGRPVYCLDCYRKSHPRKDFRR